MAGEVRFRLSDNLDPLQTLDICHEIVNMTFCSSETPYPLKKHTPKSCLDRYDSSELGSESSDSGVATFIAELGSPLTPDSRTSDYSVSSPDGVSEPIMAPPQSIQNSTEEIDLACWPWTDEWTADVSNIELFSDPCDNTEFCKSDSNIELKNATEDDSCNNLNIFQDSSKINDLFNSLPLTQCKLIESSNMKSECDFIPNKKFLVSDEKSPTIDHLCNNSNDSLQFNVLEENSSVNDRQKSLAPLKLAACADNFDTIIHQKQKDGMNISISVPFKKHEIEKPKDFDEPNKKKLCVDQTTMLSNKGRYFMRSSSASSHDLFQTKISHLLDQNKNLQDHSTSTKLKCSLKSPISKSYQCDNNCSIKNNEQLNYTTIKTPASFSSNKIRFPKSESHWISLRGSIMCHWNGCNNHFATSAKLIEHLQVKHVNSQTFGETFVCLWSDCKVFNKPSCSRSWLERHVLSHGGNKPLQCIVQKCRQRFSSQITLERHVNQHFKLPSNREDEVNNGKLIRRRGKKLRLRRQPFTARKFDYFDESTMMGLQTQLFLSTQNSQHNFIDYSRKSIKFQPNVIARRILDENKKQELLIRWFPPDILDDEWITCDINTNVSVIERNIPIMSMSTENRELIAKLFGNIFPPSTRRLRK